MLSQTSDRAPSIGCVRTTLGIASAALLLLAGCGDDKAGSGHKVDRDQWRRDLQTEDVSVRDWAAYQDTWLDWCKDPSPYFLTMQMDDGVTNKELQIDIENACPSQQKVLDETLDAGARADRICGSAREDLSAEDRDFYDAVCVD